MSGSLLVLLPLWAAAMGAVVLPVLIHLLGRGEGKTVEVASLRWFPAREARRARRFRPSRWWLLLARCLVLILLALALASPRWLGRADTVAGTTRAWQLVDPAAWERREELARVAPAVTEALEGGSEEIERRWLAPGFRSFEETPPTAPSAPVPDLWGLLQAADAAAPAGASLQVVGLDRAVSLRGERPRLGRPVTWLLAPEPGVNAWRGPVGRTLVSDAESTRVAADGEWPTDDVFPGDDGAAATAAGPLAVLVRAPEGSERDRLVVERAVETLVAAGWPLELVGADSESAASIVFSLGTSFEAPPEGERWAFSVAAGGMRACPGIVRPPGTAPGPFRIERCVEAPAAGRVLWRDPEGEPLLRAEVSRDAVRYHYASRLDPRWSALGDGLGLALWLTESWREAGLGAPSAELPESDRRAAVPGEVEARPAPRTPAAPPVTPRPWPERWLWSGLAFTLVVERWLAGRSGS